MKKPVQAEHTGGKVNYYLAKVNHPQREEQQPYQAECEDIIEALGMTFDEGCAFKAIWRTASLRTNGIGKIGQDAVYDAQKVQHYGRRMERKAQIEANMVDLSERVAQSKADLPG